MKIKEDNDFHQLLIKAERFCAYQERSSFEVSQKMKELNADEKTIRLVLASLEEDDYQNNERFAMLFASGKFRIKKWGKNKIRAELRMKNIPDSLIQKGLDAIRQEDYITTLKELAKKKEKEVRGQSKRIPSEKPEVRTSKIGRFLLSKGYESELIWKILKSPL